MKLFSLSLFWAILTILDPYPLVPVFRNRNILVRIRILGSVPLNNGSGSGSGSESCSFNSDLQIIFFFFIFFLITFTSFFTDKKKSQNSRNQGFLTIFCLMMGGSRSVPLSNGSGFGSGTLIGTISNFCR